MNRLLLCVAALCGATVTGCHSAPRGRPRSSKPKVRCASSRSPVVARPPISW